MKLSKEKVRAKLLSMFVSNFSSTEVTKMRLYDWAVLKNIIRIDIETVNVVSCNIVDSISKIIHFSFFFMSF